AQGRPRPEDLRGAAESWRTALRRSFLTSNRAPFSSGTDLAGLAAAACVDGDSMINLLLRGVPFLVNPFSVACPGAVFQSKHFGTRIENNGSTLSCTVLSAIAYCEFVSFITFSSSSRRAR